jgi:hypothetical protein
VRGLYSSLYLNHKQITKKINNMGNLLYLIAIILIIGWAVGFFFFSLGAFIHLLLIFAIIAILFRLIRGEKVL